MKTIGEKCNGHIVPPVQETKCCRSDRFITTSNHGNNLLVTTSNQSTQSGLKHKMQGLVIIVC